MANHELLRANQRPKEPHVTELLPFVFIRHGETAWNRAGLFQGRTDVPLNETGREQACAIATEMANLPITRVLVSPLQRAFETAKLAFSDTPNLIEIEKNLIECDFGSLEGSSISDAMKKHAITRKEQLADILPPDGESWADLLQRCNDLMARISVDQKAGSIIALVGHDAVLQGLSEILTGRWFDSKHGQPNYFKRVQTGWEITSRYEAVSEG